MKKTARQVTLILLLVLCPQVGSILADDSWDDHPPWLGSWHAIPEISRILSVGDAPEEKKELKISFFVNKDAANAVAGKELIERVESFFAKRSKHQIIAAGRWTDQQRIGVDGLCFVTELKGARFLWFGDPSKALTGAEVSYIRGSDPQHDLLILDSSLPSFMKTRLPKTKQTEGFFIAAGYQRAPRRDQ